MSAGSPGRRAGRGGQAGTDTGGRQGADLRADVRGAVPTREQVRALPKVELHCHVDGAARPETLLDLARQGGLSLPAGDVPGLLAHVRAPRGGRSLRAFLSAFEVVYPVLALPGAMARVAAELVHDAAADGVVHLEARFCPALQATPSHGDEAVLREVLAGLAEGGRACGLGWGAIVCLYRPLPVPVNERLVDLALAHAPAGVVGVDLAGPEEHAGAPLARALRRAREGGLGVTVHAGEAAGPASVAEALAALSAQRLGHAVALAHDDELAGRVREAGVALECCLTSNRLTGATARLAGHPFDAFRRRGLAATLATDDPLVCGTTLTDEYLLAARTWGYGLPELADLARTAARAAFLGEAGRAALLARIDAGVAA